MKLYPVMINLNGKKTVVIGGGEVAARKVSDLLDAGASVKVVSPEISGEIIQLSGEFPELVTMEKRTYRSGDLEGAFLAFSATNNQSVNAEVFLEAEERGILINAADDPPNCSFYVPSFIRRGELIFALSTGGTSPAMAARLRREIEKHIPGNIDIILKRLNDAREMLKNGENFSDIDSPARGEMLKKIVNDDKLLEAINRCSDEKEMIEFLSGVKDSCS